MEIINSFIPHDLRVDKYFNSKNICFFDIETTGFSRTKNIIYLIGLLHYNCKDRVWHLRQFFANDMNKEKVLLKEFLPIISTFDKVVTYNGDAFDIPFIESRNDFHGIDYRFNRSKSFDLYQLIRKNKIYLDLPDLKLKTIERSLGFYREDKYSGGDCIGFYYDYINSGDKNLKDNILKHNYDDLVHMLDIIPILDVLDNNKSISFGPKDVNTLTIDTLQLSGDMLIIKGVVKEPLERNIKYYDDSISVTSKDFQIINLSIELNKGYISKDKKCFFIDTSLLNYLDDIFDLTDYPLPDNIMVLMIENEYVLDNIKNLLKKLLNNIIQKII